MPQQTNRPEDGLPTRGSLLARIRNPDDATSWADFAKTYERLVYRVAQQAGLQHHECEEVVQETIISVSRHIAEFEYRPAQCSFKTWLLNLTRWRIIDQVRKRDQSRRCHSWTPEEGGLQVMDQVEHVADPSAAMLDELWESEWREHLLKLAMDAVKEKVSSEQFQIFHLLQVRGWSVAQVREQLGVSAAKVYLTKHRVAHLVRNEVKRLQRKYR